MSAQDTQKENQNFNAFLYGNSSEISSELEKQLLSLGITIKNQTQTLDTNGHITAYNLNNSQYIYYFLTESLLTSLEYQHQQSHLLQIIKSISSPQTKLILITPHPSDYYHCNSQEQFKKNFADKTAILKQQNHILSCVELVKQQPLINSRIIAIRQLLPKNPHKDSPLLSQLVFSLIPRAILIPKSSDLILRPILVSQTVKQIIKTTFSQQSKHQIYTIEGNLEIPFINLAYKIQNLLAKDHPPMIQSCDINTDPVNFPSTIVKITSEMDLDKYLKNTVLSQTHTSPQATTSPQIPTQLKTISKNNIPIKTSKTHLVKKIIKNKTNKTIHKKSNLPLTIGILLSIGTILTVLFLTPVMYYQFFVGSLNNLKLQNTKKSSEMANQAILLYPIFSKTFLIYTPIINTFSGGITAQDLGVLVKSSKQGLDILSSIDDTKKLGSSIFSQIISNQKGNIFEDISALNTNIQKIYETIGGIEASVQKIDTSKLNSKTKNQTDSILIDLKRGRGYLQNAQQFLNIAGEFFGSQSPKTYLLLLQNNHELRATGGFIGSFALITFDGGRLLDIETHDVYTADGQLRGHIEPPAALKKYLGEANWFLRDSNWDPNFPTTARRAEWFLNKEMNRQVDGTISIDLYLVKDILDSIGGVELLDYNETITSDNLFQRAEYHSELNYFEGSTQKKDFLSALINSIYSKAIENDQDIGMSLISAFIKNAEESHIQISLRDDMAESSIENSIFSGKVVDPECQNINSYQCLIDYFGIVESNVGVNKVNYFVNRSISHQAIIKPQQIDSTISLNLENSAQTAAWPAGTYKNYIRFVIPQYASVNSLLIDNKKVPISDIDIEKRHQKKYVGVYVEIPLASKKNISLEYQYDLDSLFQGGYVYQTFFEKQSGTDKDELNFSIENKSNLKITQTTEGTITNNQVNYKTTTQKDRNFIINLL